MCVFGAEFFCEEGPQTEFRDGLFRVTQRLNADIVIRRCYSPATFMAAIVAALEAVEAYQETQPGCAVLPFKLKAVGKH